MSEAIEALRKKLIKKVKTEVSEKYSEKDNHIIQAINALDDLDSIFNLLAEHSIEWYGTHFPELSLVVRDNEKYLSLAIEIGSRKNFSAENVSKLVENPESVSKIVEKSKNSMGSEIELQDLKEIQKLCEKALSLKKEREDLSKFIETKMNESCPNFSKIAGPLLGAKLLSAAGGLKRLAFLPSSTIQLLGAEKALFQHIKTGCPPPKHGFIYQHPLVKKLKPWQKGNISRTLAGKLSICARTDYYGKENIAGEIQKQLDKRILEIEKQKPNPKPKQIQATAQNKEFRKPFSKPRFDGARSFGNKKFGEKKENFSKNSNNSLGSKRFGKPFKKRF